MGNNMRGEITSWECAGNRLPPECFRSANFSPVRYIPPKDITLCAEKLLFAGFHTLL